jgi:hypothetical protein
LFRRCWPNPITNLRIARQMSAAARFLKSPAIRGIMKRKRQLREKARMPRSSERGPNLKVGDEWPYEFGGGPTTSVGGPTASVGGPTTSVGGPTASVGGPTTSVGGPTASVGGPTASVGDQPPKATGFFYRRSPALTSTDVVGPHGVLHRFTDGRAPSLGGHPFFTLWNFVQAFLLILTIFQSPSCFVLGSPLVMKM